METYLELEELWETVKPNSNADGTLPAIDERKCRRAFFLLLDPINYMHVEDAKTAREVWAKFEAAFEDTGLTRRVALLGKLIINLEIKIVTELWEGIDHQSRE